jgi:hypothetical protein
MTNTTSWRNEYSIETTASRDAIWALFRDVAGWKEWNLGIESIELRGPFATGTEFSMKPPGQDAFISRLVDVRENEAFVDETRVGDLVVVVAHRIEGANGGRVRITYAVEASGPGCEEIGPAIASDFPDVLKALAQRAEAARRSPHVADA